MTAVPDGTFASWTDHRTYCSCYCKAKAVAQPLPDSLKSLIAGIKRKRCDSADLWTSAKASPHDSQSKSQAVRDASSSGRESLQSHGFSLLPQRSASYDAFLPLNFHILSIIECDNHCQTGLRILEVLSDLPFTGSLRDPTSAGNKFYKSMHTSQLCLTRQVSLLPQ